jgi:hypothetical protein
VPLLLTAEPLVFPEVFAAAAAPAPVEPILALLVDSGADDDDILHAPYTALAGLAAMVSGAGDGGELHTGIERNSVSSLLLLSLRLGVGIAALSGVLDGWRLRAAAVDDDDDDDDGNADEDEDDMPGTDKTLFGPNVTFFFVLLPVDVSDFSDSDLVDLRTVFGEGADARKESSVNAPFSTSPSSA